MIRPENIINYLLVSGWTEFHLKKRNDLRVFQKESKTGFFQVTVPFDESLGDYEQALSEAVNEIAKEEKRPTSEIAEKLSKH